MLIHVSEAAEKDISDISRWYEEKEAGLSDHFFQAVRIIIQTNSEKPGSSAPV